MASAQDIVVAEQQQGACAMDVDIDITQYKDTGIELSKRHFLLTVFDMKGAAPHINVGEFKANLNFQELLKCEDCLTNEVLFDTLLKKYRIGAHYWHLENAKYFDCHGIYRENCADYTLLRIVFFSVKHPELLTQATIRENQSIINALNRNFMIMNSATGDSMIMEHEYQIRKFTNSFCKPKDLYDLSFKGLDFCKTKLKMYQRDTVSRAIKIENEEIYFQFSEKKLIDLGQQLGQYLIYENINNTSGDNVFINYDDVPRIRAKGGICADEPGMGKTLQALLIIYSNPEIGTVIITPNQLIKEHWQREIKKHFIAEAVAHFNILIITFNEIETVSADELKKYHRLVIDEIHELYSSKLANQKLFYKVLSKNFEHFKYRWGITGTPFVDDTSMLNLIKYLICKRDVSQQGIAYFNLILREFRPFFFRNTKSENMDELGLPDVIMHNIITKFSKAEQDIYDAEVAAGKSVDKAFLRELCTNVLMTVSSVSENTITVKVLSQLIVQQFKERVEIEQQKLNELMQMHRNVKKEMDEEKEKNGAHTRKYIDFSERLQTIHYNIEIQQKKLESRITVYKSYSEKLQLIEEIVAVEEPKHSTDANASASASDMELEEDIGSDKLCPICYGMMEGSVVLFTKCRHHLCHSCFDRCHKSSPNKCPVCRDEVDIGGIVFISNSEAKVTGTKNIEILRLINRYPEMEPKERFIIFTQYDKMISSLMKLLTSNGISAHTCADFMSSTQEIKNQTQVIVLSSTSNASGIDLSFIHNVIIIEPFDNYIYGKEIEKQLIGRVHRINQTHEVNVFRLIIAGTIEEEMYNL